MNQIPCFETYPFIIVATVHDFLKVSENTKYQTKLSISGQPPNKGELLKLQLSDSQHREPYPSSI